MVERVDSRQLEVNRRNLIKTLGLAAIPRPSLAMSWCVRRSCGLCTPNVNCSRS